MSARTFTLNGAPVNAGDNETILNVCDEQRAPLPRLCNFEGLGDIGTCRLCFVEVEGSSEPVPACLTRAEEGMVVTTDSERLRSHRRTMMGLLVAEEAWWDRWNTEHRTAGPETGGAASETGLLALRELEGLGLREAATLEVGCGTGWLAGQLAGARRYVGLDLSPAAIEIARQHAPHGEFAAVDFLSWADQPGSFDAVLMVDTIAYFRDQAAAVRRAHELLTDDGYLVVTTVNPFVYSRMSWIGPPANGQVRRWLTRGGLHDLLEESGFDVLRSYTVFPSGNQGILRLINNTRLNNAAQSVVPAAWITRAKERLGLGQYRVAVARRRSVPRDRAARPSSGSRALPTPGPVS